MRPKHQASPNPPHSPSERHWPGLFVSFEGGDGAGKTTLIDRVEAELKKKVVPCLRTREPGGSALGEELRGLLLHSGHPLSPYTELALFLAARAQHIHERIRPALEAGKVVLCDRFNDSTVAYQGFGRQLGAEKVQTLCEQFCDGVIPQLTFYLDIDPMMGLERAKRKGQGALDRIEVEKLDYHQLVRQGFLQIAKQEPKRVRVIDASRSPDEVFQEVKAMLQSVLP